MDVVNNEADKHKLIEMVEEKLKKLETKMTESNLRHF